MEFETLPLSISFDEHASSDFLDMPCDDFSIFAAASDGEKHLEEELSWEALTEIVNNVIEESQQIPQSTGTFWDTFINSNIYVLVLEDVLNFNKQLFNLFNEVSRPATSTEWCIFSRIFNHFVIIHIFI
jgi:hypothetical protein